MSENGNSCCGSESKKQRFDVLFWIGLIGVAIGYLAHLFIAPEGWLGFFSHSVFKLMNQMWIGLALGILALGFLGKVPQKIVQGAIGKEGTFTGILKACFAGLFLDLCNHGILMVATKLYERGVSLGQVLAFRFGLLFFHLVLSAFVLSYVLFSLLCEKPVRLRTKSLVYFL